MLKTEVISCPFCSRGTIWCYHQPSVWSEKRSKTATFGARHNFSKSKEIWIPQVDCSYCGKTKEEVERRLRE